MATSRCRNLRDKAFEIRAAVFAFPAPERMAWAALIRPAGYKRRHWVCMVRATGDEVFYRCKTEADARWMAQVFLKRFADQRAIESDPLVGQLLALPKEAQRRLGRWLQQRGEAEGR